MAATLAVLSGSAPAVAAPVRLAGLSLAQLPAPVPGPPAGGAPAPAPASPAFRTAAEDTGDEPDAGDATASAVTGPVVDPGVPGVSGPATDPPAPAPPTDAASARAQLDQVQHQAEALTEQWHAAQDVVAARQGDVARLQAAVGPAQAALTQAQADEESYRRLVDTVTSATYEAGNLDQLDALLAAKSPQDYLDQMSTLETLSSQYKDVLNTLADKVDRTSAAQATAGTAVSRARAAVDAATSAEQDLSGRQRDALTRIGQAEALLRQLTPAQRRARDDTGVPAPVIVGSGVGVAALLAAATQLGKPYRWGATGPGSYDCSGLTSWAFRQVGVTLPRSSSQQSTVGSPVAWNDLQAGDLVFYYHPVSHVGIYAGNGTFLDAPQTGDVVKYQSLSASLFSAARRL